MTIATTETDISPDPLAVPIELGLTRRQAEVYLYVFAETLRCGYQPSLREISEHFDVARNGIYCHLRALARKGWIAPCISKRNGRALRFLICPDGSPFRGFLVRAGD